MTEALGEDSGLLGKAIDKAVLDQTVRLKLAGLDYFKQLVPDSQVGTEPIGPQRSSRRWSWFPDEPIGSVTPIETHGIGDPIVATMSLRVVVTGTKRAENRHRDNLTGGTDRNALAVSTGKRGRRGVGKGTPTPSDQWRII